MRKLLARGILKTFNWLTGAGEAESPLRSWSQNMFPWIRTRASKNSIVAACVSWGMRNFTEPEQIVQQETKDGWERVPGHDMIELLRRPHGQLPKDEQGKLSGRRLSMGVIASLMLDGNAYIFKIRNGAKRVIGLDYIPHNSIEPVPVIGQPNVLKHYKILRKSATGPSTLKPEDVIHIADGIDDDNVLRGISPLKSVARHILTDEQVSVYSLALLRHPVASVLWSPKDSDVKIDQDDVDWLLEQLDESAAGENVGGHIIPTKAMTATKIGYSPEDMALDKLSRLPEERITAIFNLPAVIIGLRAGLERSTFKNVSSAREMATEAFLIPKWNLVEDAYTDQLLPEFESGNGFRMKFDLKTVRVLQEDVDKVVDRAVALFAGNIATRAQAKEMVDLEVNEARDDVYMSDLVFGDSEETTKAVNRAVLRRKLTEQMVSSRSQMEEVQAAIGDD